jgi:hypothetical protein
VCALVLATILTKTLYLDHLPDSGESQDGGLLSDQSVDIGIVKFCDRPTLAANQELSGMRTSRVTASNKSVQGIQAMHQICLDQELECPVHSWRCGSAPLSIEAIKDLICPCRLVAVPDQLEYPASQPRQAQPAGTAHEFSVFERRLDTIVVVVVRRGKANCGGYTVHGVRGNSEKEIVHDGDVPN